MVSAGGEDLVLSWVERCGGLVVIELRRVVSHGCGPSVSACDRECELI